MSSELESYGLPGPTALRELLTTCEDPIAAIKTFQEDNGIQLPTLHPALKLLDLHGVRRADYYEQVLQVVVERLVGRLKLLGAKGDKASGKLIDGLLESSFALRHVAQLRAVVVEALRQLPKLHDKYLRVVVAEKALYDEAGVGVRRQVWVKEEALFRATVDPLLDDYARHKLRLLRAVDAPAAAFFTADSTKARRQWPQIQGLAECVGDQAKLYDRLLQLIRRRFVETKSTHYCALRLELLMALHDAEVKALTELDPAHAFGWCVDACVRERSLDAAHAHELKALLDDGRRAARAWPDVAAVAADPHAAHFVRSLAVKVLRDAAAKGTQAREQTSLVLLLRVLTLGDRAWGMLAEEQLGEPAVDAALVTAFLPLLLAVVSEDAYRADLARQPPNILANCKLELLEHLRALPPAMVSWLETSSLCAWLFLYYSLELLPTKRKTGDLVGFVRLLKHFYACADFVAFSDIWLHLFVAKLHSSVVAADNWYASADFDAVFFDSYLLKGLKKRKQTQVRWHLLRLLYLDGAKLGETRVVSLMQLLQPDDGGDDDDDYGAAFVKVQQQLIALQPAAVLSPRSSAHQLSSTDTAALV